MHVTWDPRQNMAYIRLRDKRAEVETVRISGEPNIDLAPDGTVYGIELLNSNEQRWGPTASWFSRTKRAARPTR